MEIDKFVSFLTRSQEPIFYTELLLIMAQGGQSLMFRLFRRNDDSFFCKLTGLLVFGCDIEIKSKEHFLLEKQAPNGNVYFPFFFKSLGYWEP